MNQPPPGNHFNSSYSGYQGFGGIGQQAYNQEYQVFNQEPYLGHPPQGPPPQGPPPQGPPHQNLPFPAQQRQGPPQSRQEFYEQGYQPFHQQLDGQGMQPLMHQTQYNDFKQQGYSDNPQYQSQQQLGYMEGLNMGEQQYVQQQQGLQQNSQVFQQGKNQDSGYDFELKAPQDNYHMWNQQGSRKFGLQQGGRFGPGRGTKSWDQSNQILGEQGNSGVQMDQKFQDRGRGRGRGRGRVRDSFGGNQLVEGQQQGQRLPYDRYREEGRYYKQQNFNTLQNQDIIQGSMQSFQEQGQWQQQQQYQQYPQQQYQNQQQQQVDDSNVGPPQIQNPNLEQQSLDNRPILQDPPRPHQQYYNQQKVQNQHVPYHVQQSQQVTQYCQGLQQEPQLQQEFSNPQQTHTEQSRQGYTLTLPEKTKQQQITKNLTPMEQQSVINIAQHDTLNQINQQLQQSTNNEQEESASLPPLPEEPSSFDTVPQDQQTFQTNTPVQTEGNSQSNTNMDVTQKDQIDLRVEQKQNTPRAKQAKPINFSLKANQPFLNTPKLNLGTPKSARKNDQSEAQYTSRSNNESLSMHTQQEQTTQFGQPNKELDSKSANQITQNQKQPLTQEQLQQLQKLGVSNNQNLQVQQLSERVLGKSASSGSLISNSSAEKQQKQKKHGRHRDGKRKHSDKRAKKGEKRQKISSPTSIPSPPPITQAASERIGEDSKQHLHKRRSSLKDSHVNEHDHKQISEMLWLQGQQKQDQSAGHEALKYQDQTLKNHQNKQADKSQQKDLSNRQYFYHKQHKQRQQEYRQQDSHKHRLRQEYDSGEEQDRGTSGKHRQSKHHIKHRGQKSQSSQLNITRYRKSHKTRRSQSVSSETAAKIKQKSNKNKDQDVNIQQAITSQQLNTKANTSQDVQLFSPVVENAANFSPVYEEVYLQNQQYHMSSLHLDMVQSGLYIDTQPSKKMSTKLESAEPSTPPEVPAPPPPEGEPPPSILVELENQVQESIDLPKYYEQIVDDLYNDMNMGGLREQEMKNIESKFQMRFQLLLKMIQSVKREFDKKLNFSDDSYEGVVTFSEDEEDQRIISARSRRQSIQKQIQAQQTQNLEQQIAAIKPESQIITVSIPWLIKEEDKKKMRYRNESNDPRLIQQANNIKKGYVVNNQYKRKWQIMLQDGVLQQFCFDKLNISQFLIEGIVNAHIIPDYVSASIEIQQMKGQRYRKFQEHLKNIFADKQWQIYGKNQQKHVNQEYSYQELMDQVEDNNLNWGNQVKHKISNTWQFVRPQNPQNFRYHNNLPKPATRSKEDNQIVVQEIAQIVGNDKVRFQKQTEIQQQNDMQQYIQKLGTEGQHIIQVRSHQSKHRQQNSKKYKILQDIRNFEKDKSSGEHWQYEDWAQTVLQSYQFSMPHQSTGKYMIEQNNFERKQYVTDLLQGNLFEQFQKKHLQTQVMSLLFDAMEKIIREKQLQKNQNQMQSQENIRQSNLARMQQFDADLRQKQEELRKYEESKQQEANRRVQQLDYQKKQQGYKLDSNINKIGSGTPEQKSGIQLAKRNAPQLSKNTQGIRNQTLPQQPNQIDQSKAIQNKQLFGKQPNRQLQGQMPLKSQIPVRNPEAQQKRPVSQLPLTNQQKQIVQQRKNIPKITVNSGEKLPKQITPDINQQKIMQGQQQRLQQKQQQQQKQQEQQFQRQQQAQKIKQAESQINRQDQVNERKQQAQQVPKKQTPQSQGKIVKNIQSQQNQKVQNKAQKVAKNSGVSYEKPKTQVSKQVPAQQKTQEDIEQGELTFTGNKVKIETSQQDINQDQALEQSQSKYSEDAMANPSGAAVQVKRGKVNFNDTQSSFKAQDLQEDVLKAQNKPLVENLEPSITQPQQHVTDNLESQKQAKKPIVSRERLIKSQRKNNTQGPLKSTQKQAQQPDVKDQQEQEIAPSQDLKIVQQDNNKKGANKRQRDNKSSPQGQLSPMVQRTRHYTKRQKSDVGQKKSVAQSKLELEKNEAYAHKYKIEMLQIIQELYNFSHDDCEEAFDEPVTEDIAPGYLQEIKHPMDMLTIRQNFDSGQYSYNDEGVKALYRHTMLIVTNCLQFNIQGDDYFECGINFQKKADDLFQTKFPEILKSQEA